jgi:hypothetical protein
LHAFRPGHPIPSCSVANFGTAESKITKWNRLKPNMKKARQQTNARDPKISPLGPEFPAEVANTEFIIYRAGS